MKDYQQRMQALTDELHAQGVPKSTSAPPAYRLAWRMGLRVRPPLYQSFASLAIGMGLWFGVLWGLVMWLLFWRRDALSITTAFGASLAAGVLFGLMMAAYYRRKARGLRLPPLP